MSTRASIKEMAGSQRKAGEKMEGVRCDTAESC